MNIRHKKRRLAMAGTAAAAVLVLVVGGVALAGFSSSGSGVGSAAVGTSSTLVIKQTNDVLYDSTISPLPGSLPSQAFQATQTSEFGNEVTLAGTPPAPLKSVTVTMESWTCQNWQTTTATTTVTPCTSEPGTGYTVPITFTVYDAGATGAVGEPIAKVAQTFKIPFRPSATSGCPHSTGTRGWLDTPTTAGKFDVAPDTKCHNGLANNITFTFSSADVVLPRTVVYGISFDTQSYGSKPVGAATPQTSLNVALTTSAVNPTVGTDVYPGQLDVQSATPAYYCQSGSTNLNVFRLASSACWTVNTKGVAPWYLPAVQFDAATTSASDLYPGGPAQPIDYSVTNPGTGTEHLTTVTIAVTGTSTSSCKSTWFTITGPPAANVNLTGGQTAVFNTKATIKLLTKPVTQDACKGATVRLSFTSD